jgi:DNA-binding NtrC family response regulator
MTNGGTRIVVVDDDEGFLNLVTTWLRDAGYDVVGISQFGEAKRLLLQNPPDVLISDVRLGAFNGMQLVVLTKLEHPEVLAIVLTGYDDPVLREETTRAGAYYMVKPVTAGELVDFIAGALKPR